MGNTFTRREALVGFTASAGALRAAAAPATIETHVHLFDPGRVPYAPDAPYQPAAYTLEDHRARIGPVGGFKNDPYRALKTASKNCWCMQQTITIKRKT
jgi:hypothetical protein